MDLVFQLQHQMKLKPMLLQDLPQEHVLAGLRQHRRHRMFIRSSRLRKINGQILKTRISFMFMLNNIKIKVS